MPPNVLYQNYQVPWSSRKIPEKLWYQVDVGLCGCYEVSQVRLEASNISGEDAQVGHSSVVARHSTRSLAESWLCVDWVAVLLVLASRWLARGDVCCVECRVSSAFGLLASKQHYFDAVLQQCIGRGVLVFPLVSMFHTQMLDALYGGNIHTLLLRQLFSV